jgi:hypothetical protein
MLQLPGQLDKHHMPLLAPTQELLSDLVPGRPPAEIVQEARDRVSAAVQGAQQAIQQVGSTAHVLLPHDAHCRTLYLSLMKAISNIPV